MDKNYFYNFKLNNCTNKLLFSNLINKLKYYKKCNPNIFNNIVQWTNINLQKIIEINNELKDIINDTFKNHKNSKCYYYLNFYIKNNYFYSSWYQSFNKYNSKYESGELYINNSNILNILEILTERIENFILKLNNSMNSEYDIYILEKFNHFFSYFEKISNEFKNIFNEYQNILKTQKIKIQANSFTNTNTNNNLNFDLTKILNNDNKDKKDIKKNIKKTIKKEINNEKKEDNKKLILNKKTDIPYISILTKNIINNENIYNNNDNVYHDLNDE